jgi:WD40-like Beta Propeller Repeat
MSGPRAALTAQLCLIAVALVGAPRAGADVFGPTSLVSEGTLEGGPAQQAEYAHDAAISADGRYVAFDGAVGGITGVWRRDLATGAIEQVAGGDAELPSISEDGRFISFTSNEDLVPEDEASGVNVWVRDMEPGAGEPQYILASAVDGSTKALSYEYAHEAAREEREYGSSATGRSAISADGQEVAFVTTAVSDLAGAHTPAGQVAVRYLQARQTVLVSGAYDAATAQTGDEPVSSEESGVTYGAVFGTAAFRPVPANGEWGGGPPAGASISADGSTVAWMGEDIDLQARMLPGEHPGAVYTEPLWRRIASGSETPTERVSGGSDPANPACVAGGEAALPEVAAQSASDPCQGPFRVLEGRTREADGLWDNEISGRSDFVPRLSADGYTVAFVASAVPTALGIGFTDNPAAEPADLYVADMHPGLTRDQALTAVTQIAGTGVADGDPISDFDISPDGRQVAFTTRRSRFPLGSPAYVSVPAAEPAESELFDADLADATLTRVTHGYEGGPSFQPHTGTKLTCPEDPYCGEVAEGAQSPSFSDGTLIAFSSTASNLVFGDGNTPPAGPFDGSDAFVVERESFSTLPTPEYISPAPTGPGPQPAWQLQATSRSRRDGSVVVYVTAPGAGSLHASARANVTVTLRSRASRRRRAAHAGRRRRARETVVVRALASATAPVRAEGGEVVALVLVPAKRYAGLVSRSGGLTASVSLSFSAPGHEPLHQAIQVTFARAVRAARARRTARKARSHRRGAHGGSAR